MWLPVSLSDRPWLGSPTGSPSLGAAPLLGNFLLPHLYPTLLCLADCYLVPRLTFLGSLRDLPHFGLGDLISVHPLFPHAIDAVHTFALLSRLQRTYGLFDALSLKAG